MERPARIALCFGLSAAVLTACGASDRACPDPDCRDAGVVGMTRDAAPRAVEPERACAMQSTAAVPGLATQVDVLFVIDNSGSMADEIEAVRANINANFAKIIADSGVDYRVIMVSRYGPTGTNVCIEPPLAGAPCSAGLAATNGERYFQYSVPVDSLDPWCRLLGAYDRPDPDGRAPFGLRQWLRAEAKKVIVLITDDSPSCTIMVDGEPVVFGGVEADPFEDALRFHEALLSKAGEQLPASDEGRYRFYAIVGLQEHAEATEPYFPHEPVVPQSCDTAASPGLSYQALSVITDALRYPVCDGRGFDAVFQVLARDVVDAAKADCTFELPAAPEGQSLERATVRIEYTPGDASPTVLLLQTTERARCSDRAFYFEGDRILLCPEACAIVESDRSASLQVLYGCSVVPE